MRIAPVLIILLGFLAIGASFILQLLVALGLPYIKGIYFLYINFGNTSLTNNILHTTYGIWSQCLSQPGQAGCSSTGLGYQQGLNNPDPSAELGFGAVTRLFFVSKLPYALVLQPISAGFTGLAAGGAFLHLCTNTFLWPLAALWASLLTMAALVIELVLFILARNKARGYTSNTLSVTGSDLGPAVWMQVASLPPVFFGFMMLALGWYMKRAQSNDNYYDDYETPRPAYPNADFGNEKDYYNQPRPISRASRRSRYEDYYEPDDARVSRNVGRRESRRSFRPSYNDYDDRYDDGYDDRAASRAASRRSYGGDGYGSRTSLAGPPGSAYRGGRSRRYSERGAY